MSSPTADPQDSQFYAYTSIPLRLNLNDHADKLLYDLIEALRTFLEGMDAVYPIAGGGTGEAWTADFWHFESVEAARLAASMEAMSDEAKAIWRSGVTHSLLEDFINTNVPPGSKAVHEDLKALILLSWATLTSARFNPQVFRCMDDCGGTAVQLSLDEMDLQTYEETNTAVVHVTSLDSSANGVVSMLRELFRITEERYPGRSYRLLFHTAEVSGEYGYMVNGDGSVQGHVTVGTQLVTSGSRRSPTSTSLHITQSDLRHAASLSSRTMEIECSVRQLPVFLKMLPMSLGFSCVAGAVNETTMRIEIQPENMHASLLLWSMEDPSPLLHAAAVNAERLTAMLPMRQAFVGGKCPTERYIESLLEKGVQWAYNGPCLNYFTSTDDSSQWRGITCTEDNDGEAEEVHPPLSEVPGDNDSAG